MNLYWKYVCSTSSRWSKFPTNIFPLFSGKMHNSSGRNQHNRKNSFRCAQFLKLPDPLAYTGHCFRRTSATLLVNGGSDILQLKRHGGWKSSIHQKITASQIISGSTSSENISDYNMGRVEINSISNIRKDIVVQQQPNQTTPFFNLNNFGSVSITYCNQ